MPFISRSLALVSGFIRAIAWGCGLVALAAAGAWARPAALTQQTDQKPEQSSPAATPALSAPTDAGVAKKNAIQLDEAMGLDPMTGRPLYETIQEDWSSLAIGVSKLEPEPALVAQTEDKDGFTRTLVQMKWRPGDLIDVYVILPKGVKKPPVVLYLYGYKEDTDRFRDDRWCERVTGGGVAAVGFVSALSGHRFHGRPMAQWFASELQESLGSTVHDVHFILDYLAQSGDVDMDRVGMFGQGSGGTIALLSAAADSRIKAVDALDPWGDWPVWLAQSPVLEEDASHTKFTCPEFLKRVAPLDPVKWLPKLTSTRVRIQEVGDNDATPKACKVALRKAAPKQAEVVEFTHISELAAAGGGGRLFDWIKDQLKNLPPQAPVRSLVTQAHTQGSGGKGQPTADH